MYLIVTVIWFRNDRFYNDVYYVGIINLALHSRIIILTSTMALHLCCNSTPLQGLVVDLTALRFHWFLYSEWEKGERRESTITLQTRYHLHDTDIRAQLTSQAGHVLCSHWLVRKVTRGVLIR